MADVLTVDEAAGELRMSAHGIRRLIRQGRIRAAKVGKQYLITRAEVNRVLTEGTGPTTPAPAGGAPLDEQGG